jgi:hypothetical protein
MTSATSELSVNVQTAGQALRAWLLSCCPSGTKAIRPSKRLTIIVVRQAKRSSRPEFLFLHDRKVARSSWDDVLPARTARLHRTSRPPAPRSAATYREQLSWQFPIARIFSSVVPVNDFECLHGTRSFGTSTTTSHCSVASILSAFAFDLKLNCAYKNCSLICYIILCASLGEFDRRLIHSIRSLARKSGVTKRSLTN